MKRDVFISYSRKNMERVKEIKSQIDTHCSTDCWIDLKGIESGSEMFMRDIVGGIDACKVFLFMLSRESMESEYALLELNYAKEMKKNMVLVNIDDCRMTGVFLFKYSLTDTIAWKNPPQRDKLLRDISQWIGGSQKETLKPVISSTVHQPEESLNVIRECNLVPVKCDGKWGYIDSVSEKIIIPFKWKDAENFNEGFAKVKGIEDKWGFIDINGTVVIGHRWTDVSDFHEGYACVRDKYTNFGYWGYIDKSGNEVIPYQWEEASVFNEGLAAVKKNGKYGFIDKTGKEVIICRWCGVGMFSDGLAIIKDDRGKYGYIDSKGEIVIPCKWKNAWRFKGGKAVVDSFSGLRYEIDKNGGKRLIS